MTKSDTDQSHDEMDLLDTVQKRMHSLNAEGNWMEEGQVKANTEEEEVVGECLMKFVILSDTLGIVLGGSTKKPGNPVVGTKIKLTCTIDHLIAKEDKAEQVNELDISKLSAFCIGKVLDK